MNLDQIKATITTVPDYPKPGIQFRDVTTLMQHDAAFKASIHHLAARFDDLKVDKVAGTEARGFVFGAPLAMALSVGFVPIRKANKLPREVIRQEYELEYGKDMLELHRDAVEPGDRILLIDDLLATGGTMLATAALVRQLGGVVENAGFVVDLPALGGRERLQQAGIRCHTLCEFEGD